MNWISLADRYPDSNVYVLVWHVPRKLAMIAKWQGNKWFSSGNNVSRADVSHWSEIVGPNGESCSKFMGRQREVVREA